MDADDDVCASFHAAGPRPTGRRYRGWTAPAVFTLIATALEVRSVGHTVTRRLGPASRLTTLSTPRTFCFPTDTPFVFASIVTLDTAILQARIADAHLFSCVVYWKSLKRTLVSIDFLSSFYYFVKI